MKKEQKVQFALSTYANTMARYNQWMNDKLYACVAGLSHEQRNMQCGLFFGSISNSLNHLLVCDWMWLARFKNAPVTVTSLTQVLFSDFELLTQARTKTDAEIIVWAKSLVRTQPPARLHYANLARNAERDVDFAQAIVHFFNHQTHHRGQVTAALSRLAMDFGVTDLIFMPEAE